MDGIGSRMSPEERYLRSVLLNYQVCTDVVRHYFDGLHPTTSLVQYLLDQRTKFENEEKKIPNYQWIQLYPEVLFRADVHIEEKYIESYNRKDLKDYKEFTDRISTIFTCSFDSVDGDQKVKVVNLSRLESGEVLATLEITSQYNPNDRIIKQALEVPVNSGNVDASLETSPAGFSFAKQGVSDMYKMEINLTKVNAAALALKDTKEFRIMAKKLERILLLLFDTVPGTQSVEVEEFRYLSSDCATAICKLTSENHKDNKRLEEAIRIPISEGRLGKTLKTTCTPYEFSFKKVIVFEAEINVKEKFSKTLEHSNSNDFKAFANRVQPIIKGLYDSVTGEQDVEIVKCRQGPSDTVLVLFHLISHENDAKGLRAVTESKIRTESQTLSYGITDDGFSFETNKCMFEVTLRLAEKYSDSKDLTNPKSEAFKSFKEKVQPEILRLYDSVCGCQEIDILRYKIESSGAAHSIIFKLTSIDCSDESKLKEPIEIQIQTGQLGSSLKVCATDLHFEKLTETVFYQAALNVKKTFTNELKKKHSADYLAFSKFVQTVLRTQYEKVPGNQEFNVVECQQGPSGTNSTVVIIDVVSKGCTNNVYKQLCQPVKNLITLGKLELALATSHEDFSFRITRGSNPAVSSKFFDLSLLITLLRRDLKVEPPKKGFDVLPSTEDISDGAQIATIKYYRNKLAHASDTNMSEHMFDDCWSNLKNAIKHLGKGDNKFMIAVNDALTRNLDKFPKEIMIKMVQHDKQLLELEETVTEHNKKIETLVKQAKEQSASTQADISQLRKEIGKKEEQISKNRTDFQTLNNQLHEIEKKLRAQDERNVQQDEMNKNMESGIEKNRRNIQRLESQSAVRQPRSHVPSTDQLNTGSGESPDNFSPGVTSSFSSDELSIEKFINLHFAKLPKELKVGYYDVMILYSEADYHKAEKFRAQLENNIFPSEPGKIKAVLYDGPELEGISASKLQHLDAGFNRCTFTFVYLTKHFVECDWCRFSSETCLLQTIYDKGKRWCVVPVYTVHRNEADFTIPMGLNSLKGVNIYNPDTFLFCNIRSLIGDELYKREQNEKKHKAKRYNYLVKKVQEDKAYEQRLLHED